MIDTSEKSERLRVKLIKIIFRGGRKCVKAEVKRSLMEHFFFVII